jgi:hypothetical protein
MLACGVPLLLSRIARDLGKALEQRLNIQWGGQPTTILLRHQDATVNGLTKKEYHRIIGQGIGKSPPTPGAEAKNLEQADTFYRAGTAWLISKTQDTKKHALVFRENKHYGFQRNLRGLKGIGIFFAFVTFAISVLQLYIHAGASNELGPLLQAMSIQLIVPMTISGVMLLSWILLVTEKSVQRAGFAYADRLIRTCDQLAAKPKRQKA